MSDQNKSIPLWLHAIMLNVIKPTAIDKWYDTPISSAGGKTPREMVDEEDWDSLVPVLKGYFEPVY